MRQFGGETQSGPLPAFALIASLFLGLFGVMAAGLALVALLIVIRIGSTSYLTISRDFYLFDVTAILLLLASGLAAAFAVSLWTYRASANLADWGIKGQRLSPVRAAASYWVVVRNLFEPPAMMRQLVNLSDGEIPELANQSVGLVTAWWTCFVIGYAVHLLLFAVILLPVLTGIHVTNLPGANYALFAFGTAMLALAALNLFRLIRRITSAQRGTVQIGETFA